MYSPWERIWIWGAWKETKARNHIGDHQRAYYSLHCSKKFFLSYWWFSILSPLNLSPSLLHHVSTFFTDFLSLLLHVSGSLILESSYYAEKFISALFFPISPMRLILPPYFSVKSKESEIAFFFFVQVAAFFSQAEIYCFSLISHLSTLFLSQYMRNSLTHSIFTHSFESYITTFFFSLISSYFSLAFPNHSESFSFLSAILPGVSWTTTCSTLQSPIRFIRVHQ